MRPTEGYARPGRRRRRAWAADNRGNAADRRELEGAIHAEIAREVGGSRPLLDCGCGTGWLLRSLADSGVAPDRLHGVDLDPARAEAARARAPGANVAVADMTRLPYGNDLFGAVLFVVSLSSAGDRDAVRAALGEARRVLAPGGMILCYEPRIPNPLNRSTVRVTTADLAAAGATPVDRRTLTLLPPLGRRLWRATPALHPLLSGIAPLRSHWLGVHRKPTAPAR
ncbi:MAG: class I SAM-dependent methyltransferase [Thermoleophilaceae bacterium]